MDIQQAISNILSEQESWRRIAQTVDGDDVPSFSSGMAEGLKLALYFLDVMGLDGQAWGEEETNVQHKAGGADGGRKAGAAGAAV